MTQVQSILPTVTATPRVVAVRILSLIIATKAVLLRRLLLHRDYQDCLLALKTPTVKRIKIEFNIFNGRRFKVDGLDFNLI